MISICIPVYNFDVRDLVKSLHSQCNDLISKPEIILIDDCSEAHFQKINSELSSIVKYIQLDKNIGRSKIRNLFLQYTNYEYLLFLDCDSIIFTPDFINKYLKAIDNNSSVIVGGRVYSYEKPSTDKLLRWKYCTLREQKPITNYGSPSKRNFLSNNFLIQKSLFEKIRFDERIIGYGHEDTLFAYELKKAGIEINYLNNPVMNGELENNEEFLEKTERSIINLKQILEFLNYDKGFISEVTLLKNYFLVKKWNLEHIFFLIWRFLRKPIKSLLLKGIVILILFDFYKLGYFISLMRLSKKLNISKK